MMSITHTHCTRTLILTIVAAGFVPFAAPAWADCAGACTSDYYVCTRGYDERSCTTQRSICMMKCTTAAERLYGAIAYSPAKGVWGTARRLRAQSAAERQALNECRQKGGTDCSVLYFYDSCGALARSSDGAYGKEHGSTRATAERLALAHCRNYAKGDTCRVAISICAR